MQGLGWVLWLCGLFLLYRISFSLAPERAGSCKCFGVGSFLGRLEPRADQWSLGILVGMMVTAGFLGLMRRRGGGGCGMVTVALMAWHGSGRLDAQEFRPLFTAEGEVREVVYKAPNEAVATNVFPFVISVDAKGLWQLSWVTRFPQWDAHSTEHLAYDGTDIYSVIYSDKRLDGQMRPVSNLPFESNQHPGRVGAGPFPVDHSSCVGLIWLAFVGGHWSNVPNRVPDLLVMMARTDPGAWLTRANLETEGGGIPPLLKSATFELRDPVPSAELLDLPEVDEPADGEGVEAFRQIMKRYRGARDEERVRSRFRLDAISEVDGFQVPKAFSGSRTAPVGAEPPGFVHVAWSGVVNKVVATPQARPLLPPLHGKVTVQDRRFRRRDKGTYINYWFYPLGSDGWVVDVKDPRFQGENAPRPIPRETPRLRRTLYYGAIVLLCVMLVFPVRGFIRRMTRRV